MLFSFWSRKSSFSFWSRKGRSGSYFGALGGSFAFDTVGFAWACFIEACLIASVVSFLLENVFVVFTLASVYFATFF
jgi:hypothetical protein